ncbi:MAG: type II secretion system protein [Gammaproteobacteria bacterium]|nr:type II secretion system protein [Gammaproteobacteria bacterium]
MMHRLNHGFTLIEVLIFIVVSSMLMTTLLLGSNFALQNSPSLHQQWVANEVARSCMDWFLQQKKMKGYDTYACPTTPATTNCIKPVGYTVTASIACKTWNTDTNYKTITVNVTGLSSTSLSTQVGNY